METSLVLFIVVYAFVAFGKLLGPRSRKFMAVPSDRNYEHFEKKTPSNAPRVLCVYLRNINRECLILQGQFVTCGLHTVIDMVFKCAFGCEVLKR